MYIKQQINYSQSILSFEKMIEYVLCFTFISSLFFPPMKVGNLGVRPDDILLLSFIPCIIYLKFTVNPKLIKNNYLILFFILYGCMVFSTIRGYLYLHVPFQQGDINELIRHSKSLFIILITSWVDYNKMRNSVSQIIKYGSIFIIIIGILQYFNLGGIGNKLAMIYGEHHADTMINASLEQRRVILSGAGPNDGAVIALILLVFSLIRFIKEKQIFNLFLSLGLFSCILFTSSRTALIATLFILIIMIFKYGAFIYKIISSVIGFIVIIYILPYFEYIYIGFQLLMEGQNNSFNSRLEKIEEAYILFKQSFFWGWGIAKSIHATIVDSDYLLILRRYGFIGFTATLSFIHYPLLLRNKENDFFVTSLKFLCLAFAIIMYSNSVFHSYQAITAFVILTSIATSSKK
jgi:hypothetical protein